jgi:hypothetical protein
VKNYIYRVTKKTEIKDNKVKNRIETLLLITCISLSCNFAFAEMDHKHSHDSHEHQHSDNASNHQHAQMQSSGSQTVGDIRASLELMPYDSQSQAKLIKFGIIATHHMMLTLMDNKTNSPISNARASAWTESEEKSSAKIKLISMKMSRMVGYGGDINIPADQDHKIVVEVLTRDGKKSVFHF